MRRVREQKWKDAFVFFKHEDEGIGPKLAAQFIEMSRTALRYCGRLNSDSH